MGQVCREDFDFGGLKICPNREKAILFSLLSAC